MMKVMPIGLYPLSPSILYGSGTYWIAADIDDDRLDMAIKLRELLEQISVSSYIETSKSKGYHVWIFFSEAVSAKEARAIMRHAMAYLRLTQTDISQQTECLPDF